MLKRITRKIHSDEIRIAVGVVTLFAVIYAAAFFYKPTMIPQALKFGAGTGASRNPQVLKLPVMALDLRDQRELTLAIEIEVPDSGARHRLDEHKAILKVTIREIIAEQTSGELMAGNGRQRLKNDIAYAASRLLPPGTPINVYISDFHVN
jgi:flagellar basal body-associated protein FliL